MPGTGHIRERAAELRRHVDAFLTAHPYAAPFFARTHAQATPLHIDGLLMNTVVGRDVKKVNLVAFSMVRSQEFLPIVMRWH